MRNVLVFLLLTALLAISGGCGGRGLWAPLGSARSSIGLAGQRDSAQFGQVVLRIKWPARSVSNFQTAAMLGSTTRLKLSVTGEGRADEPILIDRPAGHTAGQRLVTEKVPIREGSNLTITVEALGSDDVVTAVGSAAGVNVLAAREVYQPITLSLLDYYVPRITGLSSNLAEYYDLVTITGANFGHSGNRSFSVEFTGFQGEVYTAPATRSSDSQITFMVPPVPVGPVVVRVDGATSSADTVFWPVTQGAVSAALSADGFFGNVLLVQGENVRLKAQIAAQFLFGGGKTIADYPSPPQRTYVLSNPSAGGVILNPTFEDGAFGDTFTATAPGVTQLTLVYGTLERSLTVEVANFQGNFTISSIAGSGRNLGDVGPSLLAVLDHPQGLALDANGDLLVADSGHRRIRTLGDRASTLAMASNEPNGPVWDARLSIPKGMAVDKAGALYVADAGSNVIWKIQGGQMTTVAGTGFTGFGGDGQPANTATLGAPWGVAVDASGDIIIADTYNTRIRVIAAYNGTGWGRTLQAGSIYTIAGSSAGFADGPSAQFSGPRGIAVTLRGTIYVADTNSAAIRQISFDGSVKTIAGSPSSFGYAGDGGPASAASLNSPEAVVLGPDGTLFVADTGNHVVRAISPDGIISTVAGTGVPGLSGDRGPARYATLAGPSGLALDRTTGTLYISDTLNDRVRKVSLARYRGDGTIRSVTGSLGNGFPALEASLQNPTGVVVDPVGRTLIVDTGHHQIRAIGSDGAMHALVGTGEAGFSGDGGNPLSARLHAPSSVHFDPQGNLFIADTSNKRIRMVPATDGTAFGKALTAGTIVTIAGGGWSSYAYNMPAVDLELASPLDVSVTDTGDLLFTDGWGNAIYQVARASGALVRVAGTGNRGSCCDGPATAGQLYEPRGIVALPGGGFLFADGNNQAIKEVSAAGILRTVVGGPRDGGRAINGVLNSPWDVCLDGNGGFYFTDFGDHVIRWLNTQGALAIVAGTIRSPGYSGDDGRAEGSRLRGPTGLALDAAGRLLLADSGTERIRRLEQ